MNSIKQAIQWFRSKFKQTMRKSSFYENEVNRLNSLLTNVGQTYRYGIFGWKEARELERSIKAVQLPIVILNVNNNGAPNIEGVDEKLIESMNHTIVENICKRKELVRNQEYEKAARFRDSEKIAFEKMFDQIKEKLNLTEGINYHKGELVIVKPKDVNKAKALSRALKNLNISGINF